MSYVGNTPFTAAFLTDTFSGNGSTVAFTMSVAPATTSSVIVAITGVLQDPSTYSVSGTTLTFSAAPPTGTSNISVRYLGIPASGVTTTAYRTQTEFTATAGQTTFSVPSYTVGFIDVYRNGLLLGSSDFTATNGTTVVLTNAASAGDFVETVSFYVSSVLNALPNTGGTLSGQLTINSATGQSPLVAQVNGTEVLKINSAGNLGIGTASPTTMLQLSGSAAAGKDTTITLNNTTASTGRNYQIISGDGGPFRIYDATAAAERMRIDSSGNVGIGTNSPTARLDVSSTGVSANFGSSTAFAGALWKSSTTTGEGRYVAAEADAMTFGRYGVAEHMRIDSSGNVGIGISPATKLSVASDSEAFRVTPASGVAGTAACFGTFRNNNKIFYIGNDSSAGGSFGNANGVVLWNSAATAMAFATSNAVKMLLDASGRLLVGATTAKGGITVDSFVAHTTGATFSGAGGNAAWTTGFTSQSLNTGLQTPYAIQAGGVYAVSDIRLKENIASIPSALRFIEEVEPVEFFWKTDGLRDTGYIAQDLLAKGYGHLVSAIPDANMEELAHEDGNVSPSGMRFVAKYDSVVPILHRAIQEQQAIITQLQADVAALKGNQ